MLPVAGRVFKWLMTVVGLTLRTRPVSLTPETIHSHVHYALMSAWFVSVVEKLKLEAVFAISTQVTLYT